MLSGASSARPKAGSTASPGSARARINLERASILLVDDALGLEILGQIFYGFGARNLHRCRTIEEATQIAGSRAIDLVVTEALLEDGDGHAFIRRLRMGEAGEGARFAPVMVLSAHTAASKVSIARDCGANFFVAKPISPLVIMERLLWVAREKRQYLETETYVGPDRRFHDDEMPTGVAGRRRGDRAPTPCQEAVSA